MTYETRHLIALSDVLAVEFECAKCRTKIVLKLNSLDGPPLVCPVCNTQWVIHSSQEHANLHHFLQRMKGYAEGAGNFVMRLEIRGPEK